MIHWEILFIRFLLGLPKKRKIMKIVCRPKTTFRKLFREAWSAFYGMHCAYCTKECESDYSVDHIIPRSKGGRNKFSNMVIACKKCNYEKGDKMPNEFRKLMLEPIEKEIIT
jgi:5-methylcytosine-specific restriction endonuclease McrA